VPDSTRFDASIERFADQLQRTEYPRTNRYEPGWVLHNLMGPNVLWLAESLMQVMPLDAGARVLDLGSGKAVSSIFLAKEFGVEVWSADLWIKPTDNWLRIKQAGVEEQVFPIFAEAHALPFAEGFFDAIVSFDAYHYFGTNDLYLGYLERFVKPGGQLGFVVPGLVNEFRQAPPDYLSPYWQKDFYSFHSPGWWARHLERTGHVRIDHADLVPDGWRLWLDWQEVCRHLNYPHDPAEEAMLRADEGRTLGFTRIAATRM
jgi:cyclopropane fatty-acyl-phospholipid synthase-like methyltransferase